MANDIVWYDSSETGAPTLNNAAGSLDSVLYACLVTGFRSQTLTSLTVSGGVATATLSGHGYSDGRMVEIAGASTSAINGRKKVTVTGSGTFTFPAPGVTDDGTISGTITAKRSPLGWSRALNSGNVSIYERTDVTATAMKLRVDDSGSGDASATQARFKMIESFADINTVTNQAPPTTSLAGGGVYIHKGANSTTAKKWVLVGDSRTFYLLTEQIGNSASSIGGAISGIYGFGDAQRVASGDAYCCFVAGTDSGTTGGNDLGDANVLGTAPGSGQVWWQRLSTGVGLPVRGKILSNSGRKIGGGSAPTYPSPVDNGMVIQQVVLAVEDNTTFSHPIRGVMRGMADPLAALVTGVSQGPTWDRQVLSGLTGTSREFLTVPFVQSSTYGCAMFDITGPWA